jgi:4-amino-4-deoxy-L-arabinose transferase-like glycosyltransferase
VTPLAARLGFVLLFAGSTWLTFRIGRRLFGADAGLLAATALNCSAYHSIAAGTFVLPDGPLLFFWLLTIDRMAVALDSAERGERATGFWMQVGAAWGMAMLSKYHAVFLPLGAVIYLAARPSARRIFLTPGPWLAVTIGAVIFSPVIWWNATHGWASFAFQSGRAVGGGFRPDYFMIALAGQVLYLTPWIWRDAVTGLVRLARGRSNDEPIDSTLADRPSDGVLVDLDRRTFLLSLAGPILVMFFYVALRKPVLPHWSLVGLLPAFPLIGRAWAEKLNRDAFRSTARKRVSWSLGFVVVATLFTSLHARFGLIPWDRFGATGERIARVDVTLDGMIWDRLAKELESRGWVPGQDEFLFTSRWYESGHLARELGPGRTVLCYNRKDSRGFSDWAKPEDYIGRDGILVSLSASPNVEPACFDRWFAAIEPLGKIEIRDGGMILKTARVYRCRRQLTAFPFDRRPVSENADRAIATRNSDSPVPARR